MKVKLIPVIVLSPDPDAARELDEALDTLADALAEQLLARARAEVLGLPPSDETREADSPASPRGAR